MSGPHEVQQQIVNTGDVAAVGVTVGALAGWLPAIAAIFTIVWTGIRIYETKTMQSLIARFRNKKMKERHTPLKDTVEKAVETVLPDEDKS